ncbi:MAG: mercuric reductase [Planctomycetaceae bacterium]|jgi:pyruvate/2-oxoglutarate dehydrogenase complex dihydrolipoamide dehydrogenase (E3) component|nr:mercuric reductase [Planctomycetaceae bacterium]MDG2388642.1 mercuric reductase [Planctomycetaceae bacterium]
MSRITIEPEDQYNLELINQVHPPNWKNPVPNGRYNLVVIGAGTAGLVCAAGAAGMGAKVALIERSLMGGDCLNYGCVPSKGIISAAKAFAHVKDSHRYGVQLNGEPTIDFAAAMERMRKMRAEISHHDSAQRFTDLGVDIFLGQGSFSGFNMIEVGGQTLNYKKAVIATGARAAKITFPGIDDVDYYTNETIFSLTELPVRLGVIGGGPIGTELAQTFARFGSQVTQFEKATHILSREDADAANIVQQSLIRDGVQLRLSSSVKELKQEGAEKIISYEIDGETREEKFDAILVSIGRQPNIEGLNLEAAGVEYHELNGVIVNDYLQTSNKNIYAAGDICFPYKFTHTADFLARNVIRNALFMGRAKTSSLVIPWCTYTEPEIAHVGLSEKDAKEQGIEIDTYLQELAGVDRAILDGEVEGFVKVHVRRGKDQILGATVVAAHAGDLISEITVAMNHKIGLSGIGNTIHPYPTQAEAIRKLGDQYSRTRLTPVVASLFKKWLKFTR